MANIDKIILNGREYTIVDGAVPSWAKNSSKPTYTANEISGLSTVATSGDYEDLENTPEIPSISGLASTTYVDNKVAGVVNSAPETLDTLYELAAALGDDPNFATTVTNQIAAKTIYTGSVAGKLYRTNVGGTGNFTVSGNSGCIPNIPAGTYVVAIYAKSSTQSYTYRFNFGSVTYDLATTNGIINDIRTVTLSSAGTFSGMVYVGSVASGSILSVTMYNFQMPVNTVGMAAVTNSYNDLNDTPNINNGTLTIQKNGTTVGTFTANQAGNTTANITVPTVDSSLTGSSQTNPVQGGVIYTALQNKANKNGSSSEEFSVQKLSTYQNSAHVDLYINRNDEDDETGLIFMDSTNGGELSYVFDSIGASKTIATTDDIAALTASDVGADVFVVNIEDDGNDGHTSDKTNAEIYAAWQAGRNIIAIEDSEYVYGLSYMPGSDTAFFNGISYEESNCISQIGIHTSNNVQTVIKNYLYLQDALVSGTNIKTISNQSLLGSGNLTPSQLGVPNIANNLTTTTTGSTLDATQGKALKDLIDGITVPSASTTTPVMDGTAAIGSSSEYAKADHVHPSDTSKANVITKTTVSTSGAVSQAMTSGVFYSFTGTPTSLTLTLTAPSTGLGIYAGKFTASSTGCTLSVPASVTESIDNPNIVANGTYEFNIMDNVLLMVQI